MNARVPKTLPGAEYKADQAPGTPVAAPHAPRRALKARKSDGANLRFIRSTKRLREQNGLWYVRTREGNRGPFVNRRDAVTELLRYADTMRYVDANRAILPDNLDWDDVTIVTVHEPRTF